MTTPINVGILDSGISLERRATLGHVIDAWTAGFSDYDDRSGHGTACAALIRLYSPTARIFNLKIFDGEEPSSVRAVIDGIRWCLDHEIHVVNLSLAIPEVGHYHEFADLCRKAMERQMIIVAAADNLGRVCLPAYLDGVLGVGAARLSGGQFYYRRDRAIQLYAGTNGAHTAANDGCGSASFATAGITGIVARELSNSVHRDAEWLDSRLRDLASPFDEARVLTSCPDFDFEPTTRPVVLQESPAGTVQCGRAVLFGSRLETMLFRQHEALLRFDLVDALCPEVLPDRPGGRGLEAANEADVLRSATAADTLIIGHTGWERSRLAGLAEQLTRAGKNVLFLRPEDASPPGTRRVPPGGVPGWMCSCGIDEHNVIRQLDAVPPRHIPKSLIPVLGIVPVGPPRVAKLGVELTIRELLSRRGHRVAHIGSAPYSELFGCDFSYWSGCLPAERPTGVRVAFAKAMVETLNIQAPDSSLIIAGCDQGPCPSSFIAGDFFTPYSEPILSFLFGIQPDAVIVVVDELSPPDVVSRNTEVLRHLLGSDVLFLLHDSPFAAYASAIGRRRPQTSAPGECPFCELLRQSLSYPLVCSSAAGTSGAAVAARIVNHFGLHGDLDVDRDG